MVAAVPLIPVADALSALLASVAGPAPRSVAVRGAAGLVAAERVIAPAPVPARWIARREGIAVASADLVGASPYTPVPAVSEPPRVAAGEALPTGTDAVLPAAALQGAQGLFEIGQSAHPGENAVPAGSDLEAGVPLLAAGLQITARHRLALEEAGVAEVAVLMPRLAIVPVIDAPALRWLVARLEALGCRLAAPADADIVLLAEAGGFADGQARRGIALRPGHAHLVHRDGRDLLALPSRFDAVAAAFFALVVPMVARLTGRQAARIARPLSRKVASMVGSTDVVLVREAGGGWEPLATGEAPLTALLAADAVGLVPPESEGAAAGTPFDAWPIDHPLAPMTA